MAFRQLTEAECGQTNPLVSLGTHFTRDHAYAESHGHVLPSSSDQLVEQFLQETRAVPQTFRMDDLMREMHDIESRRANVPPVPASAVKDQLNDDVWALQYLEDGKNFNINANHDAIWSEIHGHDNNVFSSLDPYWEEKGAEGKEGEAKAKELVETVDDAKITYSKFMQFMKKVGEGEVNIEDGDVTEGGNNWAEEYLNKPAQSDSETQAQNWAEEHVASNNDDFNSQFFSKMQEEWKKLSEEDQEHPWLTDFTDFYYKDYTFSETNPMFDVLNPLQRGKEFLESGDLPSAVLCFEAAIKREPENVEAWQLLGTTQAENEQDPSAISALKKCIQLDPTNLTALMALAVSYTNENYYNQACQTLASWLKHNPKYADLIPPNFTLSGQVTSLIDPVHHKAVQDLFIKAAQRNPQDIDYEVQCGLGVLFNLSGEYNKAADCFRAALSVKPNDAKLWNRLGATLANGSRPEEAVEAYHRALNLEPGFIRARYNVGITCINLSAHKEAGEHFLTALNQQARGKDVTNTGNLSQMSDTIWSTLKMCVALMNRSDLREAIDKRDLATLNQAFNIHDN